MVFGWAFSTFNLINHVYRTWFIIEPELGSLGDGVSSTNRSLCRDWKIQFASSPWKISNKHFAHIVLCPWQSLRQFTFLRFCSFWVLVEWFALHFVWFYSFLFFFFLFWACFVAVFNISTCECGLVQNSENKGISCLGLGYVPNKMPIYLCFVHWVGATK